MKQITNRVAITGHITGDKWRIAHAENQENGNDYMHAQAYALSPAVAATLQASGVVVGNSEMLVSVAIDPVGVCNG